MKYYRTYCSEANCEIISSPNLQVSIATRKLDIMRVSLANHIKLGLVNLNEVLPSLRIVSDYLQTSLCMYAPRSFLNRTEPVTRTTTTQTLTSQCS